MRALVSSAALAVLTTSASARPHWASLGGGAQLHYEVTSLHDVEHPPGDRAAPQDVALAGARLHGFVGGRRFGYHVGLDLAAGQTARPHSYLAYDVAVFPLGIAVRFATTSFATLGVGVGANGAVASVDDALAFPIEARIELGRAARLLCRARVTYLTYAGDRERELEAMLGLRLGDAYSDFGFPTGNGYFIGASYREAFGARFAGVTLGFSIDMATSRTKRRP